MRSARSARSGRSATNAGKRATGRVPASSMRPTGPRWRSIQSRTTGSEVVHMSSLRVEVARHAFDHHHGLLQHDELGPRRHVEEGGDLEQQRQQLRHRDLVGAAVVDRLADGADRLREILDRMMRRHVAGLEMDLARRADSRADEAEQDLGQEAPLLHAEPAHDAEIDGDETALRVDEEIARDACRRGRSRRGWRGAGRSG